MDEFTRWLQLRLSSHGFPCGEIDGVMGPKTQLALEAFQRSRRVVSGFGRATQETIDLLRQTSSQNRVSVQDRDPAQISIDTRMSSSNWPREADCEKFFGPVGTRQTTVEVPFDMFLAWSMSTRQRTMTVHELVAPSLRVVLQKISEIYSASERSQLGINRWGGSLNVRRKRGGRSWSMHSWGIAIDWDPSRNQLNMHSPSARLSHRDALPFWLAWESEGWVSLGRECNFDWMHVQAARL